MTTALRKLVVIGVLVFVLVLANAFAVTNWLAEQGWIELARHVRSEYVTGTAITVIVTLLILLTAPARRPGDCLTGRPRCPVCDAKLASGSHYCSECGRRV